jgi:hypothetical protein
MKRLTPAFALTVCAWCTLLVVLPLTTRAAGDDVKRTSSVVFGNGIAWSETEPWNTMECRRNFLLGMTEHSSFLVPDETGFETFAPNEAAAAKIYRDVARVYAGDIGVDPSLLATSNGWKKSVAESLQQLKGSTGSGSVPKLGLAYLAGVYARRGTPTGFQFSGTNRGYEIAGMITTRGGPTGVAVQLFMQPGFPGGSTITILDGGEVPSADFFTLMKWIAAGVQKPADRVSRPQEK